MQYKDYYETLGVPRTATQDEIKQAYRKLARKYHPDVSKEAGAEGKFKDVNEANEVLKDPEKRAAYDRMGADWKAGQDFTPPPNWDEGFEFRGGPGGGGFQPGGSFGEGFDASDFFEQLFGRQARAAGGARRQTASRGEDHHAKVLVTIEDAYRGAERSIALRVPKVGADGRVELEERRLDIKIPKGIRPGQSLRLSGQGEPGANGAPAGDLYLEIDFEPNTRYRVEGGDVTTDLRLAPWEAALGAEVPVRVPDGSELTLTVPKNSQPGRRLRLKGKGLPARGSGAAGDLYAVLQVVVPPAEAERAREAYEAMQKAFGGYDPRA